MGFLYGLTISRIPAPSDPLALSAGYFVAPWLVLPFLAGWLQRSALWAAAAGAFTGVLCMFGFYLNAFPEYHPAYLALKETASGIDLVLGSAVLWVTANAMWYVIAVVAGIAFGLLGRWLRITGSPVPVIVLGTVFILEPLAHLLLGGGIPRPYVVWVLEVVAGLALPAWTVFVRKQQQAGFA
ncbi:MAG: hypothetical protein Kow0067_12720 [Coriobacteriia bacterium]|jgi:hypothetical protein